MSEPRPLVGVVLAGGDSKRFGADKGSVEVDGQTLVARAASRLAAVCSDVVVADRGRGVEPQLRSIYDGPGHGPAAGILGAARAFPQQPLLILACDLPQATPALLHRLAAETDDDWFLPRHAGGIEPLCARYGPVALAALQRQVETGHFSLQRMLQAPLRTGFLEKEDLLAFGSPAVVFLNINTPADLLNVR